MVTLQGNTGPYLQYAAARVRSILRTAADTEGAVPGDVVVGSPAEHDLALALLGFGDVVVEVGAFLEPHRLCGYLFDLAQTFSVFYENCPVLNADPATRSSRLTLCRTTLDVLATGLDLLGIASPERM